jgi:kinesin family protein C2/C3
MGPQISSLEVTLTEARQKLEQEQKARRAAEQAQDEADQRYRELEQTLAQVREENDLVHEELAFKENELDEAKMELEVEKEQLLNELNSVRAALEVAEQAANAEQRNAVRDRALMDQTESADQLSSVAPAAVDAPVDSANDEYTKKLEEELELVTEQLIETEKRLSDNEAQTMELMAQLKSMSSQGRSEADEEAIRNLESENTDLKMEVQRLREDVDITKEELTLAREECQLQQEEMQAWELDAKEKAITLEEERAQYREQINNLQIRVKEAEASSTARLGEAALVASTVKASSEENAQLRDEIEAMQKALENAQRDYEAVLDELEIVNARFDEAKEEARQEGREQAMEEAKTRMESDTNHEILTMKDQLAKLSLENKELQSKVEDTEVALNSYKESKSSGQSLESEVTRQLQAQLMRVREEVAKKEEEITTLTETMEKRLSKAEETVAKLEGELTSSKSKLSEAEAHIIVLKRDKERASHNIPPPSPSRQKTTVPEEEGIPRAPSMEDSEDDDGSPSRRRARSTSPVTVTKLEFMLLDEKKKYGELEKEHKALQEQKRMGEMRIKRLEEDLRVLQKELFANTGGNAVVTQMTRLSSMAVHEQDADAMIAGDDEMVRIRNVIQSNDPAKMSEELKSLEKRYNGQKEYNAQLLSKMLHLQGNIQVYCRVRPMGINEIQQGQKSVVEALSETEVGCFDNRSNKWKSFVFDRVWGPDQSQLSVFQDVEPLALSVVDGFNACIFAYGQTGSGKTFTMEGLRENNQYGISYRTIQKIFHLLNIRAQQQRAAEMFVESATEGEPAKEVAFTFSIDVGMLEIYNDEIFDLLSAGGGSMAEKKESAARAGGKSSLEIRRNEDGRIEVPNLTREKVNSIDDVMELLKRGNGNRATASTDMNEHSSRSHMVLAVDVYSGVESQRNKGTLFLVDLAGSERVRRSNVQGQELKEAGFINKSLSALGNVMEALDRKASHIPYRDSKLTYLLQDSIGGNSRTMMVVNISPTDGSYDESVHALQFATRVRRIQIGAAQRNVTSKNLEETVKNLTEEMRALTRAKERSETQLLSLKRDNNRVQDKLKNLTKTRTQNKTDTKTLDVLKKNNDDLSKRWQKEKQAREEQYEELDKTRKELRHIQQQQSKANMKIQMLEKKLEVAEADLDEAKKQLRSDRTNQAATAIRSRRDQVMHRNPPPVRNGGVTSRSAPKTPMTPSSPAAPPSAEATEQEVAAVREKVLGLLEKHDKGKVDRIDIIMEKFKGKEMLLLEKMTQRYEGAPAPSPSQSAQRRNELALKRHEERMRKIREAKQGKK